VVEGGSEGAASRHLSSQKSISSNKHQSISLIISKRCQPLIFVRYADHVLYNRSPALTLKPQIREAVGWLVYECDDYITLAWDRDAEPPTLNLGGKASGLVLLKSDILEMKKIG
jgi:hypothetical protein